MRRPSVSAREERSTPPIPHPILGAIDDPPSRRCQIAAIICKQPQYIFKPRNASLMRCAAEQDQPPVSRQSVCQLFYQPKSAVWLSAANTPVGQVMALIYYHHVPRAAPRDPIQIVAEHRSMNAGDDQAIR